MKKVFALATILLFLTVSLSSCTKNEYSKTTHPINTASRTPKSNEKTSLLFKYKQPIHNYKVQILWIPDSIPAENPMGCAVIYFENQNGVKFSVLDSNYVCTDLKPTILKGIT